MPNIQHTPPNGDEQTIPTSINPDFTVSPVRLQSLDVLRGIAVLGGLLIGIWAFGGFSVNQQTNLQLHPRGLNYRAYAAIVLFFEGKMLGLISLVFGAGMVLFMAVKNSAGKLTLADIFMRRQIWLLIFGLINALVFLSTGDVLFHLAIMGILLFPFIRLSGRGLMIAAIVASLIFSAKNYWNYAEDHEKYTKYLTATTLEKKFEKDSLERRRKDSIMRKQGSLVAAATQKKDTLTKEQQEDKEGWAGMLKGMKYDPKKDDGKIKSMQYLSFARIWGELLPAIQAKEAQWTYRTGIWEIAALMFLGMALFKYGFFSGKLSMGKYLVFAILALTAGILLGLFRMYFKTSVLLDYNKYISTHWYPASLFFPFEKAAMVLGYASLVMLLLQVKWLNGFWKLLAGVGQMALSNYLLQSVICALVFYGYAMGYFGRLSQAQLYLVVAEIWIVQVTFTVLWLKAFRYGPAEWLLRFLSYGTWFPIKRQHEQKIIPSPAIL